MASPSQSGVSSPAQHDLCCILIFGHPSNGKRVATSSSLVAASIVGGQGINGQPPFGVTVTVRDPIPQLGDEALSGPAHQFIGPTAGDDISHRRVAHSSKNLDQVRQAFTDTVFVLAHPT